MGVMYLRFVYRRKNPQNFADFMGCKVNWQGGF